jgi:hypothetical protein
MDKTSPLKLSQMDEELFRDIDSLKVRKIIELQSKIHRIEEILKKKEEENQILRSKLYSQSTQDAARVLMLNGKVHPYAKSLTKQSRSLRLKKFFYRFFKRFGSSR